MRIFSVIAAFAGAFNLAAGVLYDSGQDEIIVTGFPEDAPCSPWTLYMADRMNGWGKVSIDKASGVYTVQAHLKVGEHHGTGTWFRIGSAECPAETLVVKGGLSVFPSFVKGLSPESRVSSDKQCKNVLVLGDPANPNIRATLKLGANAGLTIGFIEALSSHLQYGGGLRIYNSRITSEENDDDARFGGRFIRFPSTSDEIILRNAEISRFKNEIYGLGFQTSVENCVFSRGRGIIIGKVTLRNCVFEKMGEAIYDFGQADGTLINCTFRENKRNFHLRYSYGVTCIDCDMGETGVPDIVTPYKRDGKTVYPQIISRRHVTVMIADIENNAVPGAKVTISGGPKPIIVMTGPNGECPPVLLDEYAVKATDAQPETTSCVYDVHAEKDGEKAEIRNYRAKKGDTEIRIMLKIGKGPISK